MRDFNPRSLMSGKLTAPRRTNPPEKVLLLLLIFAAIFVRTPPGWVLDYSGKPTLKIYSQSPTGVIPNISCISADPSSDYGKFSLPSRVKCNRWAGFIANYRIFAGKLTPGFILSPRTTRSVNIHSRFVPSAAPGRRPRALLEFATATLRRALEVCSDPLRGSFQAGRPPSVVG